ncbi:MAG: hypothetical protein EBW15_10440, partial [Actinobacteria bacterium]|nr:hypothetical protein [Actinomycetota bacterium]
TVNQPSATTITQAICSPSSYTFNGQSYSAAGTYTATLTNAVGCDSIITLNLTVNQPSATTIYDTIVAPNTYTFNGQTLTATGTYFDTLTNAVGCDSIVTLYLTVNAQLLFTISLNGTTYGAQSGGHTLTACSNNDYSFTLAGVTGGSLPLIGSIRVWDGAIGTGTAGPVFTDTIYSIGDLIYAAPAGSVNAGTWGVEFLSVRDINGLSADLTGGVMNFTFNVSDPSATTITQSICAPSSYTFNGQTLTTSGIYTDTLTNAAGCDSVITLNLTVNQPSATTITQTICAPNSYTFNGQSYSATGTYTATLTNAAGCDSIVTLNLTVNQPSATAVSASICANASYTCGSQTFSSAGTYTVVLTNAAGCDSVITLNLTVNQPSATTITQAICSPSSYTFNGQSYSAAGT